MFKIKKENFGSRVLYVLEHPNHVSRCAFVPSFGANLTELRLSCSEKSFSILDGFKTEAQLVANEKSKNIHLLPFPNRLREGKYFFDGKEFQLPINKPDENNAIHGFIWNREFDIVKEECNDASANVLLQYQYRGDDAGYPFPFVAQYLYRLTVQEFSIRVSVTNNGKKSMPLGIGWHPYFTFQKRVDGLYLQLPQCKMLETDARLIPTGTQVPFTHFQSLKQAGDTEFDTAFALTENNHEAKIHDSDSNASIHLKQDASFKYLQVYIPPDRNSIALEPMTCPANAFNSGKGLLVLKANERFEGKITVAVSCR